MKLTLEPTGAIVFLNQQPARIWEGKTDEGIEVLAFIALIRVNAEEDQEAFQRDCLELPEVKLRSMTDEDFYARLDAIRDQLERKNEELQEEHRQATERLPTQVSGGGVAGSHCPPAPPPEAATPETQ